MIKIVQNWGIFAGGGKNGASYNIKLNMTE